MKRLRIVILASLVLTAASPGNAAGQDSGNSRGIHADVVEYLEIYRLNGPVQLDGIVDEPAWSDIPILEMTVYQPTYRGDPTERTEIRVACDETHLYVSGRLFDSNPSEIRVNSLYRDRYCGDDVLSIVLDTYNDNENALWFYVSPAGIRFDSAVSSDAEFGVGGMPINESWNAFWDVATSRNDEGWFVEVRIPFTSLGFQEREGRVEMGLIAYRLIARKNERHIFPDIPPDWNLGYVKPSRGRDVVIRGIRVRKPLYVSPYMLGGLNREGPVAGSGISRRYSSVDDLGMDLRYNLNNNLTLNLTFNTDFAQVEADAQQVNLTRFSLFFPEKRQFFQERAAIFEFGTSGMERLFHSRRIGLTESGDPIRILVGGRMTGRIGNWDVGLIDMQTDRSAEVPGENLGVFRLRRQVFNPFSYVGGMVTSRIGNGGSYNTAYGVDSVVRVRRDDYLTLKWAQTFDDETAASRGYSPLNSGLFLMEWSRRGNMGLNYRLQSRWVGSSYNPGLGFVQRSGCINLFGNLVYGWSPSRSSPVRRNGYILIADGFFRNGDRTLETMAIVGFRNWELKNGTFFYMGLRSDFEDLREEFEFSENAVVPRGSYRFPAFMLGLNSSETALLWTNAHLRAGKLYDGLWLSNLFMATWRASRYIELSGELELNRVRFPERAQRFDARIGRLRIQGAMNAHLSMNAYLQYNSAANILTLNGRLRYHLREGNDLWLVLTDMRNIDARCALDTDSDYFCSRVLMLKYTHTFIF